MRPKVEALDVDAMDWTPLGPPGGYTKLLSRDPKTGARTALQRICPEEGWTVATVAHFHETYEEILGVYGRFSFDSRRWITPGSYVFHPPRTVHGFKSALNEESWFLSRVGQPLDFTFVPNPTHDDIYLVDKDVQATRLPAVWAKPMEEVAWTPRAFLSGSTAVGWCALGSDTVTGEGSSFVRLPAGWTGGPDVVFDGYLELFVMEGGIGLNGGEDGPTRSYFYYPPDELIGRLSSTAGALVYVNFGAHFPES